MVHGPSAKAIRAGQVKVSVRQAMSEASSVVVLVLGAQEDRLDNRDGMHARAACAT